MVGYVMFNVVVNSTLAAGIDFTDAMDKFIVNELRRVEQQPVEIFSSIDCALN
jgi:hypothetical protein